jgi:glycosyltransferase involved in cell wall biosynthesis
VSTFRLALVVDHFLPRVGGIELQVADLARQLTIRGHSVDVITTTPGSVEADGVCVKRLDGPLMPHFQIPYDGRPIAQLRELLARGRYDLVHAHASVISPLGYGACWHARDLRLPSLLTTHSLLGANALWFSAANRVLDVYGWPTRLSTVSRATARRMAPTARRSDEIVILPNGIDASRWQLEPQEHERLRVTSVMRLNVKKRPHDLVAAIPKVLSYLPSKLRPMFTIIGDGPYRPKLERQIRRLGLNDCVELLGRRTRDQIKEVFRTTDLFVLPTRHEAFGIAVLEARSAGLPVVAMNQGGVSDIIEHGRHGLLARDLREFAGYITALLDDRILRRQMAAASRRGLERFGWDQVVADHTAIYAQLAPSVARPLRVSA